MMIVSPPQVRLRNAGQSDSPEDKCDNNFESEFGREDESGGGGGDSGCEDAYDSESVPSEAEEVTKTGAQ